jgi:hypothetical protein
MSDQSPLHILSELTESTKDHLESSGVDVSGYAGGSREGDVWHFTFETWWVCDVEIASVRVDGYWSHGNDDLPSKVVHIDTIAEVFRRGYEPRIRNRVSSEMAIDRVKERGMLQIVEAGIEGGRAYLSRASNLSLKPDARQTPRAA